ncbi:polysaccharide pyruvyl transferase family protein [Paraglaciecola sp.]|uniref:polysaccharide pyruvyl transferase family protein n=1 Tax=Paraglaciecola sp. TaxID=1920173 RepID=UPI003262F6F5
MNSKKIAFIGRPGFIDNSYRKTVDELFKEVGLNTGNLAFWYAMNQQLTNHKDYFGWTFDPVYVRENYDVIVFPAANQLNPDWDMGGLADLIDKADLPLLICGLGAQAPDTSKKLNFNAGTKRFLKVISERAISIGVRGNFTAQVLAENNVNNVQVLGCPSNFINSSKDLGQRLQQRFSNIDNVDNLSLNIDITEKLAEKVRVMFHWTYGRNVEIVNQAPLDLVKVSHHEFNKLDSNLIKRVHNLFAPSVSLPYFKKMLKANFKSYYNVNEWMHQLQQYDLSLGTRLHGNMLALQSGTPSIFMAHDSRTQELADVMALPTFPLAKINRATTLEDVVGGVEFDGIKFDKSRQNLCSKYLKLINDTGLSASEGIVELSKEFEKNWLSSLRG